MYCLNTANAIVHKITIYTVRNLFKAIDSHIMQSALWRLADCEPEHYSCLLFNFIIIIL